ncbi:Uncharacterised protein [Escherichia coli]|nr:Uncharacterised protein [Escherichia coli]
MVHKLIVLDILSKKYVSDFVCELYQANRQKVFYD